MLPHIILLSQECSLLHLVPFYLMIIHKQIPQAPSHMLHATFGSTVTVWHIFISLFCLKYYPRVCLPLNLCGTDFKKHKVRMLQATPCNLVFVHMVCCQPISESNSR